METKAILRGVRLSAQNPGSKTGGRLRRAGVDGRLGGDVLGGVSTGTHERSQKLGPTGSWKSLCATR